MSKDASIDLMPNYRPGVAPIEPEHNHVYQTNRHTIAPWVVLALLMWAALAATAWVGGNQVAAMDAAATATAVR